MKLIGYINVQRKMLCGDFFKYIMYTYSDRSVLAGGDFRQVPINFDFV